MKKIISLLTLGVVTLLFTSSVLAEDPAPESAVGKQWYCLMATNKDGDGHGSNLAAHPITDNKGRPLDTVEGQVSKSYVFVKIDGHYSTGNRNLDVEAMGEQFASENYDPLKAACGFSSAGLKNTTNPVNVTGGGELDPSPVYWHDDLSCGGQAHMWYGMQKVTATGGEGKEMGNDSGLKNGNFAFSRDGMNSNCNVINWDPLGYVYDATTHGPVAGVGIKILRKNEVGAFIEVPKGIGTGMVASNPIHTLANGSYEFFSSSGDYKLELLTPHKIATVVTPGFEVNGYEISYKAGDSFFEKEGEVVRKDIAIETVNAPAPSTYSEFAQPKLMVEKLNKQPGVVNGEAGWSISGRVNIIPSDFVVSYSSLDGAKKKEQIYHLIHGHEYRNSETDVVRSKDEHYFVIGVPQIISGDVENELLYYVNPPTIKKYVPTTVRRQNEDILSSFIRNIVSRLAKYIPTSQAAEVIGIDVAPTYLEGIAYDKSGKPAPSAKVGIYVKGSNLPDYQTKADETGHYVIESRWVPPLPYEIKITTPSGVSFKISPVEYLKQNEEYHKTNEINSFTVRNSNTTLITSLKEGAAGTNPVPPKVTSVPAQQKNPDGSLKSNNGTVGNNNNTGTDKTTSNGIVVAITGNGSQGVVMVIVAIVILILIGVGAFVMMKSKQQQLPPTQF